MTEQQLEQVREKIDRVIRKECHFDYDGYCTAFSPDGMADQILNITIQIPCKECKGGIIQLDYCSTCKGTGYKEVTIKEMIENES